MKQTALQQHSKLIQAQQLLPQQSRPTRRPFTACNNPTVASNSSACKEPAACLSRRELSGLAAAVLLTVASPAQAIGFKKELKKRKIPLDEYSTLDGGLKYYDTSVGDGEEVVPGKKVTVHFDCLYKSIDVVSTRSARLLGGNRSIAEPLEFTAGFKVSEQARKKISDTANGLFAGGSGPKPPPALATAIIGMRNGGKRTVVVPPEQAYGEAGLLEIPPNATIQLNIEVLDVN